MEVCCTFKSIVGGVCGSDCRDKKHEVQVVPLQSCTKDIVNHLATWSFSGPVNEIQLILSRAAIFKVPDSLGTITICLYFIVANLDWDGQGVLPDAEYQMRCPTTVKERKISGQR